MTLSVSAKPDRLYADPLSAVSRFQFDDAVADVFADMISRSVPGYGELLSLLPLLAQRYVKNNSVVYDLGCSLGASTTALLSGIQTKNVQLIAVDNSAPMIDKAKDLAQRQNMSGVSWLCSDITDLVMQNASLIMMNFTLQFIAPDERPALLKSIYDALNPGGVLLLSEKIRYDNSFVQQELDQLHLEFKRCNGYSNLEIAQKREAIENVLLANSYQQHSDNLAEAGFSHVQSWYQNLNFTSFLAWK